MLLPSSDLGVSCRNVFPSVIICESGSHWSVKSAPAFPWVPCYFIMSIFSWTASETARGQRLSCSPSLIGRISLSPTPADGGWWHAGCIQKSCFHITIQSKKDCTARVLHGERHRQKQGFVSPRTSLVFQVRPDEGWVKILILQCTAIYPFLQFNIDWENHPTVMKQK